MNVVYQLPRVDSIAPPAPECISIARCDELVEQESRVETCYGYAPQRGVGEEMDSCPVPARALREASKQGS